MVGTVIHVYRRVGSDGRWSLGAGFDDFLCLLWGPDLGEADRVAATFGDRRTGEWAPRQCARWVEGWSARAVIAGSGR